MSVSRDNYMLMMLVNYKSCDFFYNIMNIVVSVIIVLY